MLGRLGRINSLQGSSLCSKTQQSSSPATPRCVGDKTTITRRLVMMNFKRGLAALALAFAVTALASPSYAQEGVHISRQRAQAIHECSLRAARYPQYLWGNQEIFTYRPA